MIWSQTVCPTTLLILTWDHDIVTTDVVRHPGTLRNPGHWSPDTNVHMNSDSGTQLVKWAEHYQQLNTDLSKIFSFGKLFLIHFLDKIFLDDQAFMMTLTFPVCSDLAENESVNTQTQLMVRGQTMLLSLLVLVSWSAGAAPCCSSVWCQYPTLHSRLSPSSRSNPASTILCCW